MIAALGIKLEKVKNAFVEVFAEGVEYKAIFVIEATVAGLALQTCGLLRWGMDEGVDVRWDHGAEDFDIAGGANVLWASFDDGCKLFEQRQEQALESG